MKASVATIVKALPYLGFRREVNERCAELMYDVILDLANVGFYTYDTPFIVSTLRHHFRSFIKPFIDITEPQSSNESDRRIHPIRGYSEGARKFTRRLSFP